MRLSWNKQILGSLTLCVCLMSVPVIGLSDALSDAETAGLAALDKGEFEQAHAAFQRALLEARKNEDKTKIADQLFYLGLSVQRSIRPNSEAAARQMAQAAGYYQSALRLKPNGAAALNNLAQLYAMQGSNSLALATLAQAITLPDPRQPAYTLNYADLLLGSGDWKEACRFYALGAWAQPDNEAVHQKLREVCLQYDPVLLLTYSWEMVKHGQVLRAQEYALGALASPRWSPSQKEEWLAILAVCLSKQHYPPRYFSQTHAGEALRKLAGGAITNGCAELIALNEGEKLKPSDYPWWSPRIRMDQAAPRGVWPGEAFQELCRSLAERCGKIKDQRSLAEKYLLLAVTLSAQAPDTQALVQLADFYAGSNRLDELAEMMRHYEGRIFDAKGAAIRTGQTKKIYDFHAALGVIYSHMGKWGNSEQVNSAIFQLEHAVALTKPRAALTEVEPVKLQPRLVTLLADGYWKQETPAKGFRFEVESTQRLIEANDPASASQVLQSLERRPGAGNLGVEQKRELQTLKTSLPKPGEPIRRGPGEKPAAVHFERAAHSIADTGDTQQLDPREVRALEDLVLKVVQGNPTNSSGSRQYEILPALPATANVKEVSIEGKQGRVVMEKGGKTVAVPFAVDDFPGRKTAATRYVRP